MNRGKTYGQLEKSPELIRQMRHEIVWLDNKIEEVREQMKKRPSKIKHLRDLERQKQEKENWLNS